MVEAEADDAKDAVLAAAAVAALAEFLLSTETDFPSTFSPSPFFIVRPLCLYPSPSLLVGPEIDLIEFHLSN